MRKLKIPNPNSECRNKSKARAKADMHVGFTAGTRARAGGVVRLVTAVVQGAGMFALRMMKSSSANPIHFRKYRVAPRLGTDNVRRRLLLGLHAQTPFTASGTQLA